jgi:hypothetical protein
MGGHCVILYPGLFARPLLSRNTVAMEQIQAIVSPLFLKLARRRAFGTVWTGATKALLLPIPVVALALAGLVAWLEP